MHRQLSSSDQPQPRPQPQPQSHAPIPPSFTRRKAAILEQLSVPDEDYSDLSPKGTVDAGIRDLIDEINALDGLVTTSSCAGRVSVFLEGRRGGRKGVGDEGRELPGHHLAVVDAEDEIGEDQGVKGGEGVGAVDAAGAHAGREGDEDDVDDDDDDDDDNDVDERHETNPDHGVDLRDPSGSGRGGGEGGEGGDGGTVAGVGGKGGGGRWLFVSHDPVETRGKLDSEPNIVAALLGMEQPIFDGREGLSAEELSGGESRLIHFKFEPMILHVLTASLHHAQLILSCGLQAGFRESGAINLLPTTTTTTGTGGAATPIVAIRSMGLGLESLIGRETNRIKHCTVSGEYLEALVKIANERFVENARRIERFRALLREATAPGRVAAGGRRGVRKGDGGGEWEDAEARRERKRLEGLGRAEEVRRAKELRRREQQQQQQQQGQQQGGEGDKKKKKRLYEMTLSTQPLSSLLTSSLKLSTSFQQSRGRRSLSVRQRTTSPRALSTDSGTSRGPLLASSLSRSDCTFWATSGELTGVCSGTDSAAALSAASRSRESSCCWSFLSSAATRAWTWSSLDCNFSTSSCDTLAGDDLEEANTAG
ncbi:hypothetical protein VPNG_03552 [Cytospora leucostoma]|uniref:tRNA(Phe) 7-[(3-amino-3-carboxypropyl)-4-demethylwyosine(37)-N(4)]-methyltransferase n=1 Tax=Cytospora leucostoma TaxID=1230097 RepID=A0A423XCP9_9PEZI|nr:hypothetical protein VPNG_03552 [Cytospora leucostoma]